MALLSKQNLEWRERARTVAEEVVRPVAAKYDEAQEYPWEVKDALQAAGLFGVWIPKEYGGHGGSVLDLCICVEELSRACGGVGVLYSVNALGSFPIILAGTDAQKEKYLPQIASGEKLIAFCLSEKYAGSDAYSMRTPAVKDGDGWVINGEKKWTTNGGAADLYSVFTLTDPDSRSRRHSAFIVEKTNPGFSVGKVEDKMGIRCVPVVETVFKNARVGDDALLGGKPGLGFKHAMMTLDNARPGVAAQGVGLAQGALDLAVVYCMRRKQFGSTLANLQMLQGMLADMSAKAEASRYLVYAAAAALEAGDPAANKLAAQCKYMATETAMEVTTKAVQLFGGYGFMKDYPIEKYMRDAKITQIYEGTNQVQRLVIGRTITREAAAVTKHLDVHVEHFPEADD